MQSAPKTKIKRRILATMGCAALLFVLLRLWVSPNGSLASTPASPLSSPLLNAKPPNDEKLIYVQRNGDVILYTLGDQQRKVLLPRAYFVPANSENPSFYILDAPFRPSPDGKWIIIPTPDHGTWLVNLNTLLRRQISPKMLSLTWAPDSRRVEYAIAEQKPGELLRTSTLFVQDVITGEPPQPIFQTHDGIGYPAWSPGCAEKSAPVADECKEQIFFFEVGDVSRAWQVRLINAATKEIKDLGSHRPPPIEVVPANFQWSPDGDEVWTVSFGFTGPRSIAYQTDGSTPRPLVSACETHCPNDWQGNQWTTSRGWQLRQEGNPRDTAIYALPPSASTEIKIDENLFFIATLDQLHSTEVGQAEAKIVPVSASSEPIQWQTRTIDKIGLRYQIPQQWWSLENGETRNYTFTHPSGVASLSSDQLYIQISADYQMGGAEENIKEFWRWAEKHKSGDDVLHDKTFPIMVINDYARLYYDMRGELTTLANRPAVRLQSNITPFAEQILVPMKYYNLTMTIWPRPSNQDAILDKILASFILPSLQGEAISHNPAPLHSGPGSQYPTVTSIDIGDIVDVVARDQTGAWLKLAGGLWVEAQYINDIPASLPIQSTPTAPTPTPVAPSPLTKP